MALRVQLGCYASHACGVSPDVWLRDAFRRMYWANPLTYALKALVVNEFDSPRWDKPLPSFEAAQVLLHAASTSDLLFCHSLATAGAQHQNHCQHHSNCTLDMGRAQYLVSLSHMMFRRATSQASRWGEPSSPFRASAPLGGSLTSDVKLAACIAGCRPADSAGLISIRLPI